VGRRMLDKTEIKKFERLRLSIDKVVKSLQESQGKSISTVPDKKVIKEMNEAVLKLKEIKFAFIKNNVSFSNDEFILKKQEQIKAVKEEIDSIIENVIPHTWKTHYDIFNNKKVELTNLNNNLDLICEHIADIKKRKNAIIEESEANYNSAMQLFAKSEKRAFELLTREQEPTLNSTLKMNRDSYLTKRNIIVETVNQNIADATKNYEKGYIFKSEFQQKKIETYKTATSKLNDLSAEFGNFIAETLNPASIEREQVLNDNGSSGISEVNEAPITVRSPSPDPLIPSVKTKKKTRTPSIDEQDTYKVSTDTHAEKINDRSKQIEEFKDHFEEEIKINENFRKDKLYNNIFNQLSDIRNRALDLINDPECNDLENIINKRKGNGECTDDKEVELLIKYLTSGNKTYQLKDGLESITLDKLHSMQSDKDKNKQVIRILQQTFTINELIAILSDKKSQVLKKLEDHVAVYHESIKKFEMRDNELSKNPNESLKDNLNACKDSYRKKSTLLKPLLTKAECMIKLLPNAKMEPALADKLESYQKFLNENKTLTEMLTNNIDIINNQYQMGESLESDFLEKKITYYKERESALDKHLSETKLIISQLESAIAANLLKDYDEAVAKHKQKIANYTEIYAELNKFCKLGETETNDVKFEEINRKLINTVNGHSQKMSADNSISFLDEKLRQAEDDFKNIELEMTTLLKDVTSQINTTISTRIKNIDSVLTEAERMIKLLPNAEMEPALADKLKSYRELLNQNRTLTKTLTENIDRIKKQYERGESLESDFLEETITYYKEAESALDKHLSETKLLVSQLESAIAANLLKDYREAVAKHQQKIANYNKKYAEINKFCTLGEKETNDVKFEEINKKSINTVDGHTQQMSADNSINFLDKNLRQAKAEFTEIELEMTTLSKDVTSQINTAISARIEKIDSIINEYKMQLKNREYMDKYIVEHFNNLGEQLSPLRKKFIFDKITPTSYNEVNNQIESISKQLGLIGSRINRVKENIDMRKMYTAADPISANAFKELIKKEKQTAAANAIKHLIESRNNFSEVNAINELIKQINLEKEKLSQPDKIISLLKTMADYFNKLIDRYTSFEIKTRTGFVQESLNIFQKTMSDDKLIELSSKVKKPFFVFLRNLITSFSNIVFKTKSQSLFFATNTEINIRNQIGATLEKINGEIAKTPTSTEQEGLPSSCIKKK
jgi:hypothetical protein